MASFNERLEATCEALGSRVCVGLDPDPARYPEGFTDSINDTERFLHTVVRASAPYAAVFKPNAAFFEAMGHDGVALLERLVAHIHDTTKALVILDVKRGDIGNTAQAYARAAFEVTGADAVTVAPYMGGDSVLPFTRDPQRGAFVLCRTSNPGAVDLQDLTVPHAETNRPLFEHVADCIRDWNKNGNVGLVAGATRPADIARIRAIVGTGTPFLIPGVGAQGGDLVSAVQAAADTEGGGFVINAGRSIMYASQGPDHEMAIGEAARALRDGIAAALEVAA